MALIHAFRGYRYNAEAVGDLDLVVTQPYDKISDAQQQEYYRRSPFSAARVTRNLEKNTDGGTDYPDAAATLDRWISQGVLIQDPEPSIYACQREYEVEGERLVQTGFIALLDLAHAASGILPHERTLAAPKADRLRLMRATRSNDDLIYMLYTDDRLVVDRLLLETVSGSPAAITARDDHGAVHRVWVVRDMRVIRKIQDAMVPEELFIADGHHRFETSVAFMHECRDRGWKPAAPESYDKRLVACFNSAAPGITILPTHRVVHSLPGFAPQRFLDQAAQYFSLEEMASPEVLWERMKRARGSEHVFGCHAAPLRRPWLLALREEAKVDPLMLAHGEAYRHLDVSILHTLVLSGILGIDEARLIAQANVEYIREKELCIEGVDQGRYQAAFFLNPTTVEQMMRVALLGERMPQKSTDFYPKLITGLVFMKMAIR